MKAYFSGKEDIHKAIIYALSGEGKRVRPLLLLAASACVGGDKNLAMIAATSVEMIHTYSLIHDDLPAMDNDDYRRGRLTVHKVFDEAVAILAGDALVTEAPRFLLLKTQAEDVTALQRSKMVEVLLDAAGIRGMVWGQAIDMASTASKERASFANLEKLHLLKTGRLIQVCLTLGALTTPSQHLQSEVLTEFYRMGRALGLAFQMADDLLDIKGDLSSMGKTPGKDIEQGKLTYPHLLGVPQTVERVKKLFSASHHSLNIVSSNVKDGNPDLLEAIIVYFEKRLGEILL